MNKGWHIYYWVAIVILLIALGLSRQAKGQDRPCGNAQMAVPDAAEREQELQEEWEDCSDMRPTVQEWCKEVLK
jgi:hypothetical protein